MKALLLVAIGGVAGSILRWQLIEALPSLSLGIFIVNQLGVLIAGIVTYRMTVTQSQKLFWVTGFAGGFTTLSSFAFILQGSTLISSFGYSFASLLISLLILNLVRGKSRA
jgi:CrcB protein